MFLPNFVETRFVALTYGLVTEVVVACADLTRRLPDRAHEFRRVVEIRLGPLLAFSPHVPINQQADDYRVSIDKYVLQKSSVEKSIALAFHSSERDL